jgi:hypothetical protein
MIEKVDAPAETNWMLNYIVLLNMCHSGRVFHNILYKIDGPQLCISQMGLTAAHQMVSKWNFLPSSVVVKEIGSEFLEDNKMKRCLSDTIYL